MSSFDSSPERPHFSIDEEWALWQSVARAMSESYQRVAEEVGPVALENTLEEIEYIETTKNELIEEYAEPDKEGPLARFANIAFVIERDLAAFTAARDGEHNTVEDFLSQQKMLDQLHAKQSGWGAVLDLSGNGYSKADIAPLEDRLADVENMDSLSVVLPSIIPLDKEFQKRYGRCDMTGLGFDTWQQQLKPKQSPNDDPNNPNNEK